VSPGDPLTIRVWGSAAYLRLWCSQVASSLGDWLGFFATAAIAARIGSGDEAAAVSIVMSARIVPGLIFSQLAGVLADRCHRKHLMVACDLARAAILIALPWVGSLGVLTLASFGLEIATLLWSSAKEAAIPNIVPRSALTRVNSLSLGAAYGTFPVAALLGALLAKLAEPLSVARESLALWVDAGTFVVSALVVLTLPIGRAERTERTAALGVHVVREVREGWQFIFLNARVRTVMVGLGAGLLGGGMLVPLGPVFGEEVLGGGPATFFLLLTALGFGVAVGVIAISLVQQRVPKTRTFVAIVFAASGSLALAASTSSLGRSFAFVLCLGACAGATYVLGFTILHESVTDELRGRVFSTLYTVVRLSVLAAFALGGALASVLDRLAVRIVGEDRRAGWLFDVSVPGSRLALWAAAKIIAAAVASAHSLRLGHQAELRKQAQIEELVDA
jgi:MFS family permease